MNYINSYFKYLQLILFLIFFSFCSQKIDEYDLLNKSNPDGLYGNAITMIDKNKIDNLLNSPNDFLEKTVFVTGEITEVCPMRGCWIDIRDPETKSNIRVKVTDGEIVFPLSSKGKMVDVQGKFTKLTFTKEQAKNWKIHLAEEQGVQLNPDDIEITEDDLIEYRINGVGADIYTFGCKKL